LKQKRFESAGLAKSRLHTDSYIDTVFSPDIAESIIFVTFNVQYVINLIKYVIVRPQDLKHTAAVTLVKNQLLLEERIYSERTIKI
jgi:hypothetical protein